MTKQTIIVMTGVAMLATLTGCDKVADTSRSVQSVTKRAFEDTKSSWRDFFTYHPAMPDPLPQTRYCYQTQSDIVCYDSEQPRLTSKLIGYQDGENLSWVQPGGGSLGASGGDAIALRPLAPQPTTYSDTHGARVADSASQSMIETGPVPDKPSMSGHANNGNQIQVRNLK